MNLSTETRTFAKFLELIQQHKVIDGELRGWWDDRQRFTYSLTGRAPEVTVSFADNDHFELILREREHADIDGGITVPFDVTDEELVEIIERTVQYIFNPHDQF